MKKIRMRLVVLFSLLIIGFLAITGCSSNTSNNEDSFSKIKEKGYIVMGLDDTFAPMGFKDEKGEIVGFDVDLAKEVFKRIGLEVRFQPIDWTMKESELKAGNIDLIWNGYSINDERKEKVAFSKPYLENKQIIVTLSNSDIITKNDLKDKNVAAQNGSSAVDAMNKEPTIVSSFKGGEPVVFDTNNEALMDLEAGRVDAFVGDEVLARYYIKQRGYDKYKVIEENFGKEEYGIGMRKGDKELVKQVDKALDDMKQDGTYEEIFNKWFK
ncbi:amino acid ABC transporter substrate-binding protein, PAAT family (TC 3.A.1.3.-) [Proteiniborus ethanoligenes]|uniref:Amino acid ABC transporter substrate-binding protein, PAAT family (TC 3.A.1.3.-) n=1 Tax=Proteiniborus ethanoligenes TaxID=415015 RepID=A0A1H3ME99_9FIRM|nr:amino acid ABC transporter substrate-binding protein [Proteiniborus ethanoligenes]SDY74903.1 amino acid ABC transporter substrate-binding protein, PAAT family (TC 3.A.1.3.-) [Proteiniborus ethanoligenes]